MRTRWILLAILAILTTSVVLYRYWWAPGFKPEPPIARPILEGKNSTSPTSSVSTVNPSSASPSGAQEIKSNESAEVEKLRLATLYKNIDIDFFGKVVDQYGIPIPGARVIMECRQWSFLVTVGLTSRFPNHETLSDSSGLFSWKGVSGDLMKIESVSKDGYLASPTNLVFRFDLDNPNRTSPNNPAIVRLWKQTGFATNLTGLKSLFGFVPDGRDHTVDLLKNKKYEGRQEGDLLIRIKRPPAVLPNQPFDWSIEIEAIEGGLVEKTDPFGYEAPEAGYNRVFKFEAKKDAPDWSPGLLKQFYVRSRGGTYSYVKVRVRPKYQEKSAIELEARINPSGARSLEFQNQ